MTKSFYGTLLFVLLFALIFIISGTSHSKTIGLLSAMPAELEHLKAQIKNQQEVEPGIIKGNIGSHTAVPRVDEVGPKLLHL